MKKQYKKQGKEFPDSPKKFIEDLDNMHTGGFDWALDAEIEQIHVTLKINAEDREELHKNDEFIQSHIDKTAAEIKKDMKEKFTKIVDK